MKKLRKSMIAGLVALTLGAGSLAAHAQKDGTGAGSGRHGHAAQGEQKRSPEQMLEHRKARFDKRQAQLHDKLKLDARQEAAWNSYLNVIRPATPPARLDRATLDKLPAPERMQKMLERMQDREKRLALHIAATREFYATLSPEQQKVFDAEFARGMGRHGGRGHHAHHGGNGHDGHHGHHRRHHGAERAAS